MIRLADLKLVSFTVKNLEAKSLTWLRVADQSATEGFAVRSKFAETGKIKIKNEMKSC